MANYSVQKARKLFETIRNLCFLSYILVCPIGWEVMEPKDGLPYCGNTIPTCNIRWRSMSHVQHDVRISGTLLAVRIPCIPFYHQDHVKIPQSQYKCTGIHRDRGTYLISIPNFVHPPPWNIILIDALNFEFISLINIFVFMACCKTEVYDLQEWTSYLRCVTETLKSMSYCILLLGTWVTQDLWWENKKNRRLSSQLPLSGSQ